MLVLSLHHIFLPQKSFSVCKFGMLRYQDMEDTLPLMLLGPTLVICFLLRKMLCSKFFCGS